VNWRFGWAVLGYDVSGRRPLSSPSRRRHGVATSSPGACDTELLRVTENRVLLSGRTIAPVRWDPRSFDPYRTGALPTDV
jgi:hypothetical protein